MQSVRALHSWGLQQIGKTRWGCGDLPNPLSPTIIILLLPFSMAIWLIDISTYIYIHSYRFTWIPSVSVSCCSLGQCLPFPDILSHLITTYHNLWYRNELVYNIHVWFHCVYTRISFNIIASFLLTSVTQHSSWVMNGWWSGNDQAMSGRLI
jgi:hypothetical protein